MGARGAFLVTGGTTLAIVLLGLSALLRLRVPHPSRGRPAEARSTATTEADAPSTEAEGA
jgi:hypothetical protein